MNFETVTSILSQIQTLVKVTLLQNMPFVPVRKPLLSRFPNRDRQGGPGQATGTKGALWSRLVTPTGTKGSASAEVAGTPFGPGWWPLFFLFLFSCFFGYFCSISD